ncbi:hypothetical protein BGX38DRAFT_1331974 [Terfezia claveryi]|nr:hypothetical protein BGX38DRAFT_1331974 [Terfezia claveryi]
MKRLIVLCDGTGQSSHRGESSFPSNVKTLGDCLAQTYTVPGDDDKHPQVIYYQSGVGTSSSSLQGLSEGFGLGIDDNILDAYYFLSNNYEEGDEIFLFGFSRGGFTARIVANLVVRLGLLHMNVSWMIRRAWAQYRKDDGNQSFDYFLQQLETPDFADRTRHTRVKVLGVWDTVGAVGLPDYEIVEKLKLNSKNEFYDTRLHWGIENVFHALALDEYRLTFGPTLFYLPTDDMKPKWFKAQEQPGKKEKIRLRQCWFAGAHTDIGGGYASSHQSNITLAWMIDNCKRLGFLTFNADTHWDLEHINQGRKWKKTINGHHRPQDDKYGSHIQGARDAYLVENEYPGWGCGIIRDSFSEMNAITKQVRMPGNYAVLGGHPGPTVVIPKIDNVINALSYLNPLSYTWPWSAKGAKVASPEPVECREQSCKHPIVKWDQPGATNETIHASVFARFMEVQKASRRGQKSLTNSNGGGPAAYIKGNILKCMRSRTTIIRMD